MKELSVAWKLKEIADLLEILGENAFKVKAYRQAANRVEQMRDLETIWREGRLREIEGVGSSIANRIEEILLEGDTPYLKELHSRVPEGLGELLHVPGLGPRLARKLRDQLGISTITELEAAVQAHRVKDVPGLDRRTEMTLLKGLRQLRTEQGRALLGIALPFGRELLARLQRVPGVETIEIVGSARRYQESVSDIDILAGAQDVEGLIRVFTTLPECQEVLQKSQHHARILTRLGMEVGLMVVPPAEWPLYCWLTTGPENHVTEVKQIAYQQGWDVEEWPWKKDNRHLHVTSEEGLYAAFGLTYIIPELREDPIALRGAQEGWLPQSVRRDQIRGDLHMHTRWSDGVNTMEEMVHRARNLGYEYIAITDHSHSLRIAKGMSIELLKEQMKAIDELNAVLKGFRVLKGIEVDILKDGQLDYPDEILAELDIVIASVHTGFNGSEEELTKRIISAMENPYVNIIAHPTGRKIHRREPYRVQIERLLEAAKATGTLVEINATPDRLDLKDQHCKLCKAMGVKVAVNTDAHSIEQLNFMEYGVGTARRGWLEEVDVINTYSLEDLLTVLRKGRAT